MNSPDLTNKTYSNTAGFCWGNNVHHTKSEQKIYTNLISLNKLIIGSVNTNATVALAVSLTK